MKKEILSLRVNENLKAGLEALATQRGVSRNVVAHEALSAYLGITGEHDSKGRCSNAWRGKKLPAAMLEARPMHRLKGAPPPPPPPKPKKK